VRDLRESSDDEATARALQAYRDMASL
jgi:hypothetical protein